MRVAERDMDSLAGIFDVAKKCFAKIIWVPIRVLPLGLRTASANQGSALGLRVSANQGSALGLTMSLPVLPWTRRGQSGFCRGCTPVVCNGAADKSTATTMTATTMKGRRCDDDDDDGDETMMMTAPAGDMAVPAANTHKDTPQKGFTRRMQAPIGVLPRAQCPGREARTILVQAQAPARVLPWVPVSPAEPACTMARQ